MDSQQNSNIQSKSSLLGGSSNLEIEVDTHTHIHKGKK